MAGKSKEFCIGTEGATTDGRMIERVHLEQMARNYDPKLYTARINLEHIKGIVPDGPFKRYGDVLSLSTAAGDDGKLRLYAVIDPTDELIALSKARQKVFTSMEIRTKFADTGEAYLEGLAITDDPASLGTEMLRFSATAKANPLAARKNHPDNLFSEAVEFTLEMEEESQGASLLEGFSSKIKGLLGGFKKTTDHNFNEIQQAVEVIADSQRNVLEQFTQAGALTEQVAKLNTDLQQLTQEHGELVTRLSSTPQQPIRPLATGGNTAAHITDC